MADFDIIDHGTLVGFKPLNDEAQAWMDENVQSESWQFFGHSLMVDHRMAQGLVDLIEEEGFTYG